MERRTPEVRSSGTQRIVMASLCAALVAVAVAYGSAFFSPGGASWSAPVFAIGTSVALGAMMALGAMTRGRLGVLWLPIVLSVVLVAGGLVMAWALPAPESGPETLVLGLPRRAAIVLYGVGLLPLLVLPLAYALTFDAATLRAEDITRVRAARDAMLARPDEDREAERVP